MLEKGKRARKKIGEGAGGKVFRLNIMFVPLKELFYLSIFLGIILSVVSKMGGFFLCLTIEVEYGNICYFSWRGGPHKFYIVFMYLQVTNKYG